MLIFVFAIIFMINLLINIDHGVIPAATTKLKDGLSLDNSSLGLLGSVVYFGLTLGNIFYKYKSLHYNIGSFVAPPIIKYTPPKIIILSSLIFEMVCLILFTVTSNYLALLFCRAGVGFFQVKRIVY